MILTILLFKGYGIERYLSIFLYNIIMVAGVYLIKNKINNKIYVGSSVDIFRRWSEHYRMENFNYSNIQKDIYNFGISNFSFEILEVVEDLNKLIIIEEEYINKLEADVDNYNSVSNSTGIYHVYKSNDSRVSNGFRYVYEVVINKKKISFFCI